jgi:hypothetical protein
LKRKPSPSLCLGWLSKTSSKASLF